MKNSQRGFSTVLIIILVLIVVVAAFIVYIKSTKYVISEFNDIKHIASIAVDRNNPNICSNVFTFPFQLKTFPGATRSHENIVNTCLYYFAINKPDSNICSKLTSYTKDNCYESIAYNTKDVSLCEQMNSNIDRCIYGVVAATGDVSYCSRIDTDLKATCLKTKGSGYYPIKD